MSIRKIDIIPVDMTPTVPGQTPPFDDLGDTRVLGARLSLIPEAGRNAMIDGDMQKFIDSLNPQTLDMVHRIIILIPQLREIIRSKSFLRNKASKIKCEQQIANAGEQLNEQVAMLAGTNRHHEDYESVMSKWRKFFRDNHAELDVLLSNEEISDGLLPLDFSDKVPMAVPSKTQKGMAVVATSHGDLGR